MSTISLFLLDVLAVKLCMLHCMYRFLDCCVAVPLPGRQFVSGTHEPMAGSHLDRYSMVTPRLSTGGCMFVDLKEAYLVITSDARPMSFRLYRIVRYGRYRGNMRFARIERRDINDFVMFVLRNELLYERVIDFSDAYGGLYISKPQGIVLRRSAEKRMVVQGAKREVESMVEALKQRGLRRWQEVEVLVEGVFDVQPEGVIAMEAVWERSNTPFEMLLPRVGEVWPAPSNEPEWQINQKVKYLRRPTLLYQPANAELPEPVEVDATITAFGRDRIGRMFLTVRYVNEQGNTKEDMLYDMDFSKVRDV